MPAEISQPVLVNIEQPEERGHKPLRGTAGEEPSIDPLGDPSRLLGPFKGLVKCGPALVGHRRGTSSPAANVGYGHGQTPPGDFLELKEVAPGCIGLLIPARDVESGDRRNKYERR